MYRGLRKSEQCKRNKDLGRDSRKEYMFSPSLDGRDSRKAYILIACCPCGEPIYTGVGACYSYVDCDPNLGG